MRRRPLYLHTVDGAPATFDKDPWPAVIKIQPRNSECPEAEGRLVHSMATLIRQQAAAIMALPKERRYEESSRLGYVVVRP